MNDIIINQKEIKNPDIRKKLRENAENMVELYNSLIKALSEKPKKKKRVKND